MLLRQLLTPFTALRVSRSTDNLVKKRSCRLQKRSKIRSFHKLRPSQTGINNQEASPTNKDLPGFLTAYIEIKNQEGLEVINAEYIIIATGSVPRPPTLTW